MIWKYIQRLVRFAFTDFAVRTDLINGLVSAVISLLVGPKNKPVTGLTTHDVALYAAMALGAYVFIRACFIAPYRLWKEDQHKIALLQIQLDLPDRALREAMQEHGIALRKDLSSNLAKYVSTTLIIGNKLPSQLAATGLKVVDYEQYIIMQLRITNILQELSYDPIVRASGWNLMQLCANIAKDISDGKAVNHMLTRLKKQAKLTFKLLHYDGLTGQVGAFAELESYLTEIGDSMLPASGSESE